MLKYGHLCDLASGRAAMQWADAARALGNIDKMHRISTGRNLIVCEMVLSLHEAEKMIKICTQPDLAFAQK